MRIDNPTKEEVKQFFDNLDNYLDKNYKVEYVKYLDLGVKTVKLICYSQDFIHLVEKQLNYVLRDNAEKYDAVLKIWNEKNIEMLPSKIVDKLNPAKNIKLRVKMLVNKIKGLDLWVFDDNYSKINPIISNNLWNGIFSAQNEDTKTYYYGVKDLNPEEIIKEGHLFVQHLNRILKTPNTNMVHGACVGLNDNGVLFCARGQRGKSTLVVLSMIDGFEYVSDDYLTLEKENDKLYAHPIYSIITLSPRMYNELFDKLKDSRFLFNNARKDKYVLSIANFHDRFKKKYPIKFCMFPEIVSDKEPSITECGKDEKGRAIVQIIQSTVCQMQDINNPKVIEKLFNMVKDFKFYKINLCNDINKNTQFLKEFLKNFQTVDKSEYNSGRYLTDITFDITNILDTKTFTIYTMNKLATAVYENLKQGISKENILSAMGTIKDMPLKIMTEVDELIDFLNELGFLNDIKPVDKKAYINPEFAQENNCKISVLRYDEDKTLELIK
ncbi:MAG: hypothetical protein SPL73_00635 [Cyanobacteriota bacterium]|nr:hypothetical protein [Cyanobacteriota bacterium]